MQSLLVSLDALEKIYRIKYGKVHIPLLNNLSNVNISPNYQLCQFAPLNYQNNFNVPLMASRPTKRQK
jgi:hypothetical protein